MYGVLGEAESDTSTIKVLIRRISGNDSIRVKTKGYCGFGKLLSDGARDLRAMAQLSCRRFVVAYDSDGNDPIARRDELISKVIRPSDVSEPWCVVIPVQEIEAWILADITAVTQVFSSWHPDVFKGDPESVVKPREYLEHESRLRNKRPRYDHTTHNKAVAAHLNLETLRSRCKSFRTLWDFVIRA